MCYDLLMNLSARLNASVGKHLRVLGVSALMLLYTPVFLYLIWTRNLLNTWVFALTVFNVELVVKVLSSLLQYVLFMIDTRLSSTTAMDDLVYVIKAVNGLIEFLCGCLLCATLLLPSLPTRFTFSFLFASLLLYSPSPYSIHS